MEYSIIEIIFLAISSGMDAAYNDTVRVHIHVINGAKIILENTLEKIGKKDFYTSAEFAVKCLHLSIENIEKTAINGECFVNVKEWYEECGNLKQLAR